MAKKSKILKEIYSRRDYKNIATKMIDRYALPEQGKAIFQEVIDELDFAAHEEIFVDLYKDEFTKEELEEILERQIKTESLYERELMIFDALSGRVMAVVSAMIMERLNNSPPNQTTGQSNLKIGEA